MENQVNTNQSQETTSTVLIQNYGSVKKYLGVIFEPTKAFQAIKEKPNFLFPLIMLILVTCITSFVIQPYQQQITEYSYEIMGISADHPMLQSQAQNTPALWWTMLAGLAMGIIGWIVMAGIVRLLSMLFMGEGKFKQDLAVFANVYIFTLIGSMLSTILLVSTGSAAKMSTNLSLLFPFLEKTSFLFWFFESINIFTLWGIIIAGLGISIIENIKKTKAYIMVLVPWLVGKLIMAAYIALFTIPMLQKIVQ